MFAFYEFFFFCLFRMEIIIHDLNPSYLILHGFMEKKLENSLEKFFMSLIFFISSLLTLIGIPLTSCTFCKFLLRKRITTKPYVCVDIFVCVFAG